MKKHLPHKEWVLNQFEKYLTLSYRNVFIHTSIIEGLLIDESEEETPFPDEKEKKKCQKQFRIISYAMKLLGKLNKNYKKLFENRNDLIHGIARKSNPLDQDNIEKKIKEMHSCIINIYKEKYINNLFGKRGYKFYPKDKVNIILEKKLQKRLSDA